ncbi:MAG TPA: IS200/IS605 family transposase [Isosphaeraceae bacterium]|nr:IS200/IS605 family transposase [Isosphaeraceae bacterium]
MDSRYSQNAGAVYSLKYHIVWCPKYRRPVLVEGVADRLRDLLTERAAELGLMIHALEVMPNHVHLFVESDPTRCVAEIVNRLKGYTSRILRSEFDSLRSRLPSLWSRSYFAGSIGQVSAATIERYIAEQKGK